MEFKLHSEYTPTGNQPQVIKELVEGFKAGNANRSAPCKTVLAHT